MACKPWEKKKSERRNNLIKVAMKKKKAAGKNVMGAKEDCKRKRVI